MFSVVLTTLAIEIATKQLGGIRREAHEFDPPTMTALTECACLLPQATSVPVANRQPNNLGDAGSGFEKDARHALFPHSPTNGATTGQHSCRERRVVDDLRNPVVADKLEVAVRKSGACPRHDHAAVIRHSRSALEFVILQTRKRQ